MLAGRNPDHFFDLGSGLNKHCGVYLKQLGLDLETRLVGGRGAELAKVLGVLRVDLQPQFLEQFTGQGIDGLLVSLDLAARLHESLGATLAHQQGPALGIKQKSGGDADGFAHGRLATEKARKDHMLSSAAQSHPPQARHL
ncbi:hypothetical protein D3C72_1454360 [compost metagenome]